MMDDDEWWDVRDASGAPTGDSFRRGSPDWPSGRFHLVVATCVYRADGTVLLTQRAEGKEFAGGWEFPGGSALAGETSRIAAARELYEEAGLAAPPDDLTFVDRFAEESALLDFYLADAPLEPQLTLQASEVAAAEWVPASEVERRVQSGTMAQPWAARLDALWPRARGAMDRARASIS